MSRSRRTIAEECMRENTVLLHDVPVLLNQRMHSCVLESAEYQRTHDDYMRTCLRLKRRISQLHYEIVALQAAKALMSCRANVHREQHKAAPISISSAMKIRLQEHAALISLAVHRRTRDNTFHAVQHHVRDLQELQSRHDTLLEQMRVRIQSYSPPVCL